MVQFPPMPHERFFRNATVLQVVDGDTLDVEIDLGWSIWITERLRLEHVNTPEMRGDERDAGRWVTERVQDELPAGTEVVVASLIFDRNGRVRGKFGRTIAHLYRRADGWCLNQFLLDQKLAWETDDNGSLQSPRELALLTGLPAELR
ncbi:thermonuclease family protein [Engelhardtia mirabilis]|uniref:TNase-like domain-containing protein n=1 Tax=Engelhardtia mirabilis TaxID=2528011 RepID=A0A518BGE4_9BACT|nr:hypothetical protein Pla133_11010 [Planctomycetes bacterium Pla133]QDV00362.1 hypothetical protein Pla86_11010 [Planctomycetes bacterium Pla86]